MAPMLHTIMKHTRRRPIGFAPEVMLSAHSWISERKDPKNSNSLSWYQNFLEGKKSLKIKQRPITLRNYYIKAFHVQ